MKVLFHIQYFTITGVKKSLVLPRTSLYTGSLYRAGLRSAVSWVGRGEGIGVQMKESEMLVGKLELNPWRRSIWAWLRLDLTPKEDYAIQSDSICFLLCKKYYKIFRPVNPQSAILTSKLATSIPLTPSFSCGSPFRSLFYHVQKVTFSLTWLSSMKWMTQQTVLGQILLINFQVRAIQISWSFCH